MLNTIKFAVKLFLRSALAVGAGSYGVYLVVSETLPFIGGLISRLGASFVDPVAIVVGSLGVSVLTVSYLVGLSLILTVVAKAVWYGSGRLFKKSARLLYSPTKHKPVN